MNEGCWNCPDWDVCQDRFTINNELNEVDKNG